MFTKDHNIQYYQPQMPANPQVHQQLTANNTNAPKAMLHIFSPRNISDQVQRAYDFSVPIDVHENILNHIDRTSNRPGFYSNYAHNIEQVPGIEGIAIPNTNGRSIYMDNFRSYYTFILIVDNESDYTSRSRLMTKTPTRMLYSGFILGEPHTEVMDGIGVRVLLNPTATMVITHKTQIGFTALGLGVQGMEEPGHPRIQSDVGVVNPSVINAVLDGGQSGNYRQLHSDLLGSTALEGDSLSVLPGNSQIAPGRDANVFSNVSTAPMQYIKQMLHTVTTTAKNIANDSRGISSQLGSYDSMFSTPEETTERAFTDSGVQLQGHGRDSCLGLDVSMEYSLATIEQRYPNLQVFSAQVDANPQYGACDQRVGNQRTVFSSLLVDALPAYMAQYGLATLSFVYDSHYTDGTITGEEGAYIIDIAESLYQEDMSVTSDRVRGLMLTLRQELFPAILSHAGHFQVHVYATLSGNCNVQLCLYDFSSLNNQGVFETDTTLASYRSPIITDEQGFVNNAINVGTLSKNIFDTFGDVEPAVDFGNNFYGY